jgi:hypothetical protein
MFKHACLSHLRRPAWLLAFLARLLAGCASGPSGPSPPNWRPTRR